MTMGPNEDGAEAYRLHLATIPCPTCGSKESEWDALRALSLRARDVEGMAKAIRIGLKEALPDDMKQMFNQKMSLDERNKLSMMIAAAVSRWLLSEDGKGKEGE